MLGKVNLPPALGPSQLPYALTSRFADFLCHVSMVFLVDALYLVHPLFWRNEAMIFSHVKNLLSASLFIALEFCAIGLNAQTKSPAIMQNGTSELQEAQLMSDAAFRAYLDKVEALLPKLEAELGKITEERISQLSYSQGKGIMTQRNAGLNSLHTVRRSLAALRVKRSISEEITISKFLSQLYNAAWGILDYEDWNRVTLTALDKYAEEFAQLVNPAYIDAMARLRILEKSSCAASEGGLEKP